MLGFKGARGAKHDKKAPRAARPSFADGGKITGPGTGISDDIEATVPAGSYIMPADSTAQIGEQRLAGMGSDVDVNLSNGEYQLPPEQVHAVGVQALDQMKNATHTPAAQQQGQGFRPQGQAEQGNGERPPAFFADGGEVEGQRRRPVYVDSQGTATNVLPSQSRAVVPAGPVMSGNTSLVPTQQPAPQPAPQAPQPAAEARARADFYGNSRGEMGRGFAPSSSRELVPTGQTAGAGPSAAGPSTAQPSSAGSSHDGRFDQQARDRARASVQADSAAYNAQRAAQDEEFAKAAAQGRQEPSRSLGQRAREGVNRAGKAGAIMAAIPALMSSAEDDSTARYAQRFGMDEPTGDGSFGDIAKFAALRGLGFASDLGSAMTFGAADGLYRDRNGMNTDLMAGGAGAVAGGAAGNRIGQAIGTGADMLARAATRGRYQGNLGSRIGAGTGTVAGGTAGFAVGQAIAGTDSPQPQPAASQQSAVAPTDMLPEAGVQPSPGGDLPAPSSSAAPAAAPDAGANNVTRVGNSFSGGTIRPGFTVNGQAFQPTGVERSPQNEQAVQNLFARTPEMGQGTPAAAGFQSAQQQGTRYTVVGDSSQGDRQFQQAFRAASTPYAGSQNGQLTANQLNNMRGLINDQRTDATSRANNAANNDARMAETQMREQGQNARLAAQEQGQNARFAASNELDQRRVASAEETAGFQNRASQRQERLYQQYEQAAPEERAAIAQQIRDLNGNRGAGDNLRNNFMTLKQPVMDERGMVVGDQDVLIDLRTGQPAAGQAARQGPQPPQNHISALRNNPALAAQFDARYGEGASQQYLQGSN